MDQMSTKQYLNQIRRFDILIRNKKSEIENLRELCTSIGSQVNENKVQTTPNQEKMATAVANIVDEERELQNLVSDYIVKRRVIISQIEKIPDVTCMQVLYLRYVEMKTFEVIAVEMDYSFRQILRLHGKALNNFSRICA